MEYPEFFFQVKKYFQYLLDDYGFMASLERYDPEFFGNCIINLQNDTFLIRITLDRGRALLNIGLVSSPNFLVSLPILIKFLAPGWSWPSHSLDNSRSYSDRLERQLTEKASLFRQYQDQLLQRTIYEQRRKELEEFIKENYIDPWIR